MKRKSGIISLIALFLATMLLLGSCSANPAATSKQNGEKNALPTAEVTAATEKPAAPAGTEAPEEAPEATEEPGPIIEPQRIADYLFEHGELPENFITKEEAKELGWNSQYNYVSDVAPGKSIGGDYFGNYEERLPRVKGRKYYECDCWYTEGPRNEYRIIFSNDGHVWYTEDHYNTFTEMQPTNQ